MVKEGGSRQSRLMVAKASLLKLYHPDTIFQDEGIRNFIACIVYNKLHLKGKKCGGW